MKDATVIFDLDGTMIDTAPDLIAATNFAIGQAGLSEVPTRVIQPAVGFGAKAMIRAAMREHGQEPADEELLRLFGLFIEFYRDNIAVRSRIYPGFTEALAELHRQGTILGVCTNKTEELALKLLAELKLDQYFAAIAGVDTFPVRKPDAGHLLGTIERAGGDVSRAVMVGDTSVDAGAARAAKVPFIAVSFGYGDSPVETLEPDAILHSYEDLIPTLGRLLPARGGIRGEGGDAD
jgi:phosphoglycolate phosphatase